MSGSAHGAMWDTSVHKECVNTGYRNQLLYDTAYMRAAWLASASFALPPLPSPAPTPLTLCAYHATDTHVQGTGTSTEHTLLK